MNNSTNNSWQKIFDAMEKAEEKTSLVCKCGGERVVLKAIEDGPEYHECKDCGRTWYAA